MEICLHQEDVEGLGGRSGCSKGSQLVVGATRRARKERVYVSRGRGRGRGLGGRARERRGLVVRSCRMLVVLRTELGEFYHSNS
jgi:hypothetical protein